MRPGCITNGFPTAFRWKKAQFPTLTSNCSKRWDITLVVSKASRATVTRSSSIQGPKSRSGSVINVTPIQERQSELRFDDVLYAGGIVPMRYTSRHHDKVGRDQMRGKHF